MKKFLFALLGLLAFLPVHAYDLKMNGADPVGSYQGKYFYLLGDDATSLSVITDGSFSISSYMLDGVTKSCDPGKSVALDFSLIDPDREIHYVTFYWKFNYNKPSPVGTYMFAFSVPEEWDGILYDCSESAGTALVSGSLFSKTHLSIADEVLHNDTPCKVTRIRDYAFFMNKSMTSLTIAPSVTSVGNAVFYGCTALKELNILDGNTSLYMGMCGISDISMTWSTFYASPLEKVYIGRNLSYDIKYNLSPFQSKQLLQEVTIGPKVTSIGKYLFTNCKALKKLEFPESVTSFESSALAGCESLETLRIMGSNTSISTSGLDDHINKYCKIEFAQPKAAIDACHNTRWKLCENICHIADGKHYFPILWNHELNMENAIYSEKRGCLVPENNVCTAKPQTPVFGAMFGGEEITPALNSDQGFKFMPDGKYAYNVFTVHPQKGNYNLHIEVDVPGTLVNCIDYHYIKSIDGLSASGNINGTDLRTIREMSSLAYLDLSDANIVEGGKSYFGDSCFTENDVIGDYCFYGMSNLKTIIFPKSIVEIGKKSIGNSLINLVLHEGLTKINDEAFMTATSLSHLSIPASVTSVGSNALQQCFALKVLRIEDSPNAVDLSHILEKAYIQRLYIGRNISFADAENSPFANNGSIRKVHIGGNANSVTPLAFENCTALRSLVLGKDISDIGESAFSGCTVLSAIKSISATPPSVSAQAFAEVDRSNCILMVPKGCMTNYADAPVWEEFISMRDNITTLPELPETTYGEMPVDLTADAPDGIVLEYASSNPDVAGISGQSVIITGAGNATIKAFNPGNQSDYEIVGLERHLKIDKANLEISAPDTEINEGDEIPDFNLTLSGLCYDDTSDSLDELPTTVCEATGESAPGEYEIKLDGGHDKNYDYTLINGRLTIKPQTLGVNDAEPCGISLSVANGTLSISGMPQGNEVRVYTVDGTLLLCERPTSGHVEFTPGAPDVYVVVADGLSRKVTIY